MGLVIRASSLCWLDVDLSNNWQTSHREYHANEMAETVCAGLRAVNLLQHTSVALNSFYTMVARVAFNAAQHHDI